jgi:methylmalonyl-CoA mutase cobalamin-binding subunit
VAVRASSRRLRPAAELLAEGAAAAPEPAPTLFTTTRGVASERAFKRALRDAGAISYHFHSGQSTWALTAQQLRDVHDGLAAHGHVCDRFGVSLDRAMGVPEDERDAALKETGPRIGPDEWTALGTTIPAQPHLGDYMIGFPSGFQNARRALAAGVTTIGNIAQYTAYDLLGGSDEALVTEETVKALGMFAACAPRGAMVHSNLEDGASAKASHYGSYLGFAALELYAVEELTGAFLTHCHGNTISSSEARAVLHLALDDLHGRDSIGSMVYGNTVDHLAGNRSRNLAAVADQVHCDISCQLYRPTGHAVNPVPLTEAERIPSAAEIVEVHLLAREIEATARRNVRLFDWPRLERVAAALAEYAIRFRDAALARFADEGVDVTDAAQLLLALRRTPILELEQRVGLAPPPEAARLEPWAAGQGRRFAERLAGTGQRLDGVRVVVGVLEVHQLVRDALARALPQLGAEVVVLPSTVSAEQVVRVAVDEDADAIVLGIYNGNALQLGERLVRAARQESYEGGLFVGGILNQDTGDGLPVDVRPQLDRLGIRCIARLEDLVPGLAALAPA